MNTNLEHNNRLAKWLNGSLSQEEMTQLEESGELNDLKFVLEDIGKWKLPVFDIEKGYNDLKQRNAAHAGGALGIHRLRPYVSYAAAVIILIGMYLGWSEFTHNDEVIIVTQTGESMHLELPDGAQIQLDAASKIMYNRKKYTTERRLTLTGQAWFKVEKGQIFRVITKNGEVEVLGTQFNVKAQKDKLEVSCYSGKVKVSSGADTTLLLPEEGMHIHEGTIHPIKVNGSHPEWLNGYTVYTDEPLSYVVDDLKKYYSLKIKLPSKYNKLEFSGKVPHNQLKQALKTIFVPMEIPYALSDDEKGVRFKK